MSRPVVTAGMLEDWRREGRSITLPRDALITPAARDWLKERALPVTWEDARQGTNGAPAGGPLAIAADTSEPMLRSLHSGLERSLGTLELVSISKDAATVVGAVKQFCRLIADGRLGRAVVFGSDGALAACLANKHRGIRAAVCPCLPAVEQAMRDINMNILVLEWPHMTLHQMRQCVERFSKGTSADPNPVVAAAIGEAEGEAAHANR